LRYKLFKNDENRRKWHAARHNSFALRGGNPLCKSNH